jgi:hypothetical protein
MELSKIHRETRMCAARELSQQLKELPALRDEFIKDVELEASTWSMADIDPQAGDVRGPT